MKSIVLKCELKIDFDKEDREHLDSLSKEEIEKLCEKHTSEIYRLLKSELSVDDEHFINFEVRYE